jgi:hypothetical protein
MPSDAARFERNDVTLYARRYDSLSSPGGRHDLNIASLFVLRKAETCFVGKVIHN